MVTLADITKEPQHGGYWDIEEFNNRGDGFEAPDGKTWYLEDPEDVAEILGMSGLKSLRQWLSRERGNETQVCSGAYQKTAIDGCKRQDLLLKLMKVSDSAWLDFNAAEFRTQWEETNSTGKYRTAKSAGLKWADLIFGDAGNRGLTFEPTRGEVTQTYEEWVKQRLDSGRLPPGNHRSRAFHPASREDERPSFEGFENDAVPVKLGQEDGVLIFEATDGSRCAGWTTTILVRATPAPSRDRQVWSLLPRYALGNMANPLKGYSERLDASGSIAVKPIPFEKTAFEITHEFWLFVHKEGDLDQGRYATYFRERFLDSNIFADIRLLNEWAEWISTEQAAGRARWASCAALPYWEGRSPHIDAWADRARLLKKKP